MAPQLPSIWHPLEGPGTNMFSAFYSTVFLNKTHANTVGSKGPPLDPRDHRWIQGTTVGSKGPLRPVHFNGPMLVGSMDPWCLTPTHLQKYDGSQIGNLPQINRGKNKKCLKHFKTAPNFWGKNKKCLSCHHLE